ncbi:hypothetical protein V8F06_012506 [Rhypophila decipiens]
MKLIVVGSTGFVATEVIRQALSNPAITSIVGVGRRQVPAPENTWPGADPAKFKSIVMEDWETYSEAVKKELSNADACIWTIAVTPSQLSSTPWETTVKICRDYAIKGIENIAALPRTGSKPFRFVYISGANAERDPAKKPFFLGEYCVLRGEAESLVLEFAKKSNGTVEAAVAKPGIISGPGRETALVKKLFFGLIGLSKIRVYEIAAALVDQVVNGFEKDTLENVDMVRIGGKVLGDGENNPK